MKGRRFLSKEAKASPNGVERFNISESDLLCFCCQQQGHLAKQCDYLDVCGKCGRKGHSTTACQTKFCELCSRFGHLPEQCWKCERCGRNGHLKDTCRTDKCDLCGKIGHSTDRCFTRLFCVNCGKNGHLATVCVQDVIKIDIDVCSQCGDKGHIAKFCGET
ncbi:MAG TPA: hypothetical protein PKD85_00970 [Saprospiraceae bacterium]|nr:hypothetical protein [Saprospiraceae bacterium]